MDWRNWEENYEIEENDYYTGLTPDNYRCYIKSWSWKKRRWAFFTKYDYECGMCGEERDAMHLHHTTYENIGEELESELIPLCAWCHQKVHYTYQTGDTGDLLESTLFYLEPMTFWYRHLTEGENKWA